MIKRTVIVAAAALSCAACANQGPVQPMGLGVHGQIDSQYAPAVGAAEPRTARSASNRSVSAKMKQTLGGKVLSAIALERVTGRKPDPRRFNELH